jgi:hypothetical protein
MTQEVTMRLLPSRKLGHALVYCPVDSYAAGEWGLDCSVVGCALARLGSGMVEVNFLWVEFDGCL